MNYFELIQKVAVLPGVNLREPQSFDTLDSQVIKLKNAVNQALKSVYSCRDWKFRTREKVFQVSAGNKYFDWTNGKILAVSLQENSGEKTGLTYAPDCSSFFQYGKPFCYAVEFGKVILFPIPNSTYTCCIKYLTDYSAVSADGLTEKYELNLASDIPLIPAKFHDLIIYKSALNYFSRTAKKEYPYFLALFYERLNQAVMEDRGTIEDTASIEIIGRSPLNRRF